MHILGTHMHIHTKYEVSILNPVARRAVHRCRMMLMPDDNYARWTNHDYIGSFGRIPNEPKNNIRKTYLSNTKGLMLYKFRRLLRENNLHEVLLHGNGYCFLSCIIIALAEHGIKKTLQVLSTEVMSHIRENKDDFYSSFESVPQSENESENLIECCTRYFQGAAYNTDSVDVCIAAIVKTRGVNLNLFIKDPVTKLMTLSKYDCNEYNSTVNLFLHYYPGSKQGKHLDAHYNCYVNTQYYKQNAAAISSMMVKTIEEEEMEKALKKTKVKVKLLQHHQQMSSP